METNTAGGSYASQQGYPTLAIDRLGSGESEHPDPILVVQNPAHAEIAYGIVQLAKAGTSPLPRAFGKVIYVGHSFGSLIGNMMNAKYPDAVDATVLTGWSSNFVLAGIPIAIGLQTLPAVLVDPAKYGDLAVGYLEVSSESGDVNVFFHAGAFDPAMQALDWISRDTLALGDLASFPFSTIEAPEYQAPVFVVTGGSDNIFCNPTALLLPPNCGNGDASILAVSGSLYPAARVYDWHVVPEAGHCWQLHYAAQDGFSASHDWLAEQGF